MIRIRTPCHPPDSVLSMGAILAAASAGEAGAKASPCEGTFRAAGGYPAATGATLMTLLLIIVLLLLLLGGPYYGYRSYGATGGVSVFGLVLLVIVVLLLTGNLHFR